MSNQELDLENEQIGKLPVIVSDYWDARPADSWVDPTTSETKHPRADQLFNHEQLVVLQKLIRQEEIADPASLGVGITYIFDEFPTSGRKAHRVDISIGCVDKEGKNHRLTGRSLQSNHHIFTDDPAVWLESQADNKEK